MVKKKNQRKTSLKTNIGKRYSGDTLMDDEPTMEGLHNISIPEDDEITSEETSRPALKGGVKTKF